jgi:Na+-translocating ferredoxin:NAD+ oxidoreductase subunit D
MKLLDLSSPPHIRAPYDAQRIMWLVLIALLFPAGAGVYFFGLPALRLLIVTTLAAVAAEAIFQWLAKRPVRVIGDGSAAVTGLLIALVLPPTLPLWMAVIGAAFAVIIVKGLFGGLGFNIFNPALAARAFLLASWPVAMTNWVRPFDAVTTATPLFIVNKMHEAAPGYWDFFLGNRAGSFGETSALFILVGAMLLLLIGVIDWAAPAALIGTVFVLTALLGHDPFFGILSGGLLLGAFFMATDYVTAPVTSLGRCYFGLGCGLLTILIRYFGGFPEGICYAILIMNMLTPLIDRYVRPRLYGGKHG